MHAKEHQRKKQGVEACVGTPLAVVLVSKALLASTALAGTRIRGVCTELLLRTRPEPVHP